MSPTPWKAHEREHAYINELLQILIQTSKLILPLLIIRNQNRLLLQQFLSLDLQSLSLSMLMINTCCSQGDLIRLCMFREQCYELLYWNEW